VEIPKNVWFHPDLNARRLAGALTLDDQVQIGAAVFLAGLFPDDRVNVGPRCSGVHPPELGVNLFSQGGGKRLADSDEFTFGLEITYIPSDPAGRAEINHALFLILRDLDVLQSDIGTFRCYSKNSDITDHLGHVTANVSVLTVQPDTSPVIQKAEQEVGL
jgi:hypothetical protein